MRRFNAGSHAIIHKHDLISQIFSDGPRIRALQIVIYVVFVGANGPNGGGGTPEWTQWESITCNGADDLFFLATTQIYLFTSYFTELELVFDGVSKGKLVVSSNLINGIVRDCRGIIENWQTFWTKNSIHAICMRYR